MVAVRSTALFGLATLTVEARDQVVAPLEDLTPGRETPARLRGIVDAWPKS